MGLRLLGILLCAILGSYCFGGQRTRPEAVMHANYCAQYFDAEEYEQAVARCRLALDYSDRYPVAWNLLGLIDHKQGRYDAAIKHYKKAISIDDKFADAHNNLGATFLAKNNCQLARAAFETAVTINPGFLAARYNSAMTNAKCGSPNRARSDYIKCLEVNPNYCDCHMGLGAMAIAKKDAEAAEQHFENMANACPNALEGHYNQCWAELQQDKCNEAISSCTRAISLAPQNDNVKQNLNAAYACGAQEDNTVRRLIQKLQDQPQDPALHFRLGKRFAERNMFKEALAEFQNTIHFAPTHIQAHLMAAKMHAKLEQWDTSVNQCQEAVRLKLSQNADEDISWCQQTIRVHAQ